MQSQYNSSVCKNLNELILTEHVMQTYKAYQITKSMRSKSRRNQIVVIQKQVSSRAEPLASKGTLL